jgi:hypothetical protein
MACIGTDLAGSSEPTITRTTNAAQTARSNGARNGQNMLNLSSVWDRSRLFVPVLLTVTRFVLTSGRDSSQDEG